MPPSSLTSTCPNCGTSFARGTPQCPSCKLDVAKMSAFAAAKKAAQARGIKGTSVQTANRPDIRGLAGESNATPSRFPPATILKTLLLLAFLAGIGYLGYHFFGPKPPRYLPFPATAQDAAKEFLTRIAGGDTAHDSAYELIADSARKDAGDDPRGDFRQVFHAVNDYLVAELRPDWIDHTTLAPDPNEPDVIIARIDLETLRIRTAQQTAPELMKKYGPHYGVIGIVEVDVNWAAGLRQMGAITGIVRGVAGESAITNLQTIIGASEANRRMPPFLKKMELLQVLRNHWAATWKSVVQTYPFRNDPVIRARLTDIKGNDQYDPGVREYAQKVLDNRVTEEDLAAVGIE
jgi:hypothetical protein